MWTSTEVCMITNESAYGYIWQKLICILYFCLLYMSDRRILVEYANQSIKET